MIVNKIEFLINDVWETVYEYKELLDITIDTYGMTIENSLGLIKMNCLIPPVKIQKKLHHLQVKQLEI